MYKVKLVPDIPFATSLDIDVYTVSEDGSSQKKRCTIKAEFARGDIEELVKENMNLNQALEYYREWIYDVVRYHILDEWEAVSGFDETMDIIYKKIKDKF